MFPNQNLERVEKITLGLGQGLDTELGLPSGLFRYGMRLKYYTLDRPLGAFGR